MIDDLLGTPLSGKARALVAAAALLLVPTYFSPLWRMTMFAPQYQSGLRLEIYSNGLAGGNDGQDLKEINLLNHYIGMRELAQHDFVEFQWMPFVIGGLALLFLRSAVFGRAAQLVDATVLFGYFALFALWSFGSKLYAYGHDLSPTAPVKVPPFTPPAFGYNQLANFEVYSYPALGAYALGACGLALVVALVLTARDSRRARAG